MSDARETNNQGPAAPAPRRVVVTGMGAISAFGHGIEALHRGLEAGESAVVDMSAIWRAAAPDLTCLVGAPLREPVDPQSIPRKFRRTMGPMAMMAYAASCEALERAAVPEALRASGRMGVSYSSTTGSVLCMEKGFRAHFSGVYQQEATAGNFFQIMSHTCAANLAHALNIPGRVISPNAACASSTLALGLGFEAIQSGRQDAMLCGGADELHPLVAGAFDLVRASSHRFNDRPSETPRPFDRDRDGTVCGEGAGSLVLEAEETARARGAPILAEIAGFDTLADGGHLAQPRVNSIVRCLHNALDTAGLKPDSIHYINAHGTGTVLGDRAEAEAIAAVFPAGEAYVSSLKGHLGHTLGASGALETIASLMMMERGRLIPTRNLQTPGEGCEGVLHLTQPRSHLVSALVKNSFAFGGVNSVLVFKKRAT